MEVKWLIEITAFPDDNHLIEALDKQGFEYQQVHRNDILFEEDIHSKFYGPTECVVFIGSLNLAKRLRRQAKWVPGVYYSVEQYNCDHYYPLFGDLLLNRNYMMLPFGELLRRKEFIYETLGEDRAIFLRPNRGDKPFTGALIYKEHFDRDVSQLGYGQLEHHELMVACEPLNLVEEWRFVCIEGEIQTGSSYKKNNVVGSEVGFPKKAFDIAKKAAKMYNPDPVWVIDVGLTKGGRYAIVEIGCFSCAGLYECNREVIIESVSRIALKEWKSYQL